jgi:predicted O-methyltransferase YrrM
MSALSTGVQMVRQYWRQPLIWPAIWRASTSYVAGRLRPDLQEKDDAARRMERIEAAVWCDKCAVSLNESTNKLPFKLELRDPKAEHSEIFRGAQARVDACPTKLGGAGNLTLLYSMALALRASSVVETGVAYGWSSLALLLAMKDDAGAKLASVDLPYLQRRNDDWVGIAVPHDIRRNWHLLRMADREGLPRALAITGPLDLAHYDSDKSREGRHFAYGALWAALRPGGVLISDDIGDNFAFRDFACEIGQEPIILRQDAKYQGILVK